MCSASNAEFGSVIICGLRKVTYSKYCRVSRLEVGHVNEYKFELVSRGGYKLRALRVVHLHTYIAQGYYKKEKMKLKCYLKKNISKIPRMFQFSVLAYRVIIFFYIVRENQYSKTARKKNEIALKIRRD
jgi:hypothetical protein